MEPKKRVTISDVAAAAGVSKTTVSRYINGREDLMSEKTRERIRAVIELTNYMPSDIASNLKKRTTNLIGLLVADITSPFSSSLIVGSSKFLEERGYTLLIADTSENPEKEKRALKSLLSKGVSGLLVNTASYTNDFLIQTQCSSVPIVLCDRHVRNHTFDIVTTDHHECISQLIRHLKERGYTRPLFFVQEWENNATRLKRREAFLESMQQIYGYDATQDVYTLRGGGVGAEEYLRGILAHSEGDLPAAVGANSITTVQVFHAARELGLSIPDQLGLCGPEDWDWANEFNWPFMAEPNVTTVKIPATQMGWRAAQLLLEKLEHPDQPPQEIYLPCAFHARGSTLRTL